MPSGLLAAAGNQLIENALRRELAEPRRSAPDAEFRCMAEDAGYLREVHRILGEFARADLETLREEPSPRAAGRQL